jgi:hypothetical protein
LYQNLCLTRYLVLRKATHRALENKKTKVVKAKEIIDYLKDLNQNLCDYEPKCILEMDETPTYVDMSDDYYTID